MVQGALLDQLPLVRSLYASLQTWYMKWCVKCLLARCTEPERVLASKPCASSYCAARNAFQHAWHRHQQLQQAMCCYCVAAGLLMPRLHNTCGSASKAHWGLHQVSW